MAQQQGQTKSALIREYLLRYKDKGPTEITSLILADNKGLKLKSQEVSTIKTHLRATGELPPKNGKAPKAMPPAVEEMTVLIDTVHYFKAFRDAVRSLGYDQAQRILEAAK